MAYSINRPIAILDRGIDPASTATRHVEILLLPMAEEQERGLEAVAAGDFPSFCFHFIACPLPSSVLQVNCTMDEVQLKDAPQSLVASLSLVKPTTRPTGRLNEGLQHPGPWPHGCLLVA